MAKRVTLFEPPPLDPSKAPIENVLELTPVLDIGPVSLLSLMFIFSLSASISFGAFSTTSSSDRH